MQPAEVLLHRWCVVDAAETRLTPLPDGVVGLFTSEFDGMVRLATLMVGSIDVAEDIVQDAFLAVAIRWQRIDRPGAYLRTCVVNGAYLHLRRRQHDSPLNEELAPAEEAVDELWDVLERLPERQRLALTLTYYSGLSSKEVASALDCPVGTAKSLVFRGLRKMRKELEE